MSVPSEKLASPSATATAEPLDEPPLMYCGIEGVPAGAIRRARADEPGGELVEIGLAERDGAGVDQRLHHGRGAAG